MAERELTAFVVAVTELFGSEQARLSAEEWVDALVSMKSLCGSKSRDWRAVTIAISARLTSRLSASSPLIKSVIPADLNCYSSKSNNDQLVSCTDTLKQLKEKNHGNCNYSESPAIASFHTRECDSKNTPC
jgi:hypothetical protein